jgi:hypothetical protein
VARSIGSPYDEKKYTNYTNNVNVRDKFMFNRREICTYVSNFLCTAHVNLIRTEGVFGYMYLVVYDF